MLGTGDLMNNVRCVERGPIFILYRVFVFYIHLTNQTGLSWFVYHSIAWEKDALYGQYGHGEEAVAWHRTLGATTS